MLYQAHDAAIKGICALGSLGVSCVLCCRCCCRQGLLRWLGCVIGSLFTPWTPWVLMSQCLSSDLVFAYYEFGWCSGCFQTQGSSSFVSVTQHKLVLLICFFFSTVIVVITVIRTTHQKRYVYWYTNVLLRQKISPQVASLIYLSTTYLFFFARSF